MVRITSTYRGELRTSAVHGPSQTELITDAPVDNQGRGESFSPTDLVATGLGTCMLTIMGIVAERHAWPLVGATIDVEKHMGTSPRRITKLDVTVRVPGEWEPKQRKALELAARECPVHRTLENTVEILVLFQWGTA